MKAVIILAVFAAFVGVAYTHAGEKYTTKYDNIDLPEILNNGRLKNKYFKCLMGEDTCTPDGQELKDKISDALSTGCDGCSPKQKEGIMFTFHHLIEKEPDMWKALVAKYDPEGVYRKKYEAEINKEDLKL